MIRINFLVFISPSVNMFASAEKHQPIDFDFHVKVYSKSWYHKKVFQYIVQHRTHSVLTIMGCLYLVNIERNEHLFRWGRVREGKENSINSICLVRNWWIHIDELAKNTASFYFHYYIYCSIFIYLFIRCLYLFNHTILQHEFNLILTVSYNLNYPTIFYCLLA